MAKNKIVAPFLKPIAILSISTGISATTVVLDSNNYKAPKTPKKGIFDSLSPKLEEIH